jgi:hypothetical protein
MKYDVTTTPSPSRSLKFIAMFTGPNTEADEFSPRPHKNFFKEAF